jgi:hypothetical protein
MTIYTVATGFKETLPGISKHVFCLVTVSKCKKLKYYLYLTAKVIVNGQNSKNFTDKPFHHIKSVPGAI